MPTPQPSLPVPVAEIPLLEQVAKLRFRIPRRHRRHKAFFRQLKRVATRPESLRMLKRFRDSIIRTSLKREGERSGTVVAVAGVDGGEGASLLSMLLALSLGASKHYRVAFLDGRFNSSRFEAISEFLGLSQNSCSISKGGGFVHGFHHEFQRNVYFLNDTSGDRSLDFFSDKDLRAFLGNLRQNFDFTVIDMPPFLRESSNVFVAPAVDHLHLVVSASKTRLADVDKCIEIAEEAGVEIGGVVVNDQKAPLWSRYFWREYFF
ncbi:MAG: hypothetical protein MK538_02790 [Planctomycetes bacterium]|nr:hypothetical protein [Planctomycetota bacterium]